MLRTIGKVGSLYLIIYNSDHIHQLRLILIYVYAFDQNKGINIENELSKE